MQTFYTAKQINELRSAVQYYKLSAQTEFWSSPVAVLQKVYNGCGPEHWCSRFRGFTTALLVQFEPAALVHDWEYSYSTKTYWAFTAANSRFLYNCIRIAVLDYGFSRLTVNQIRLAICLAVLCQLFGWNGFKKTEIEK